MLIKWVVKTERLVGRHDDKCRILIPWDVIYGPVVRVLFYDNLGFSSFGDSHHFGTAVIGCKGCLSA